LAQYLSVIHHSMSNLHSSHDRFSKVPLSKFLAFVIFSFTPELLGDNQFWPLFLFGAN
jgi:hypothetical protein